LKVVILAGGLGSRIKEYTKTIPKPMIKVHGKPLIEHIMKHYSNFGFNEFYIALGYKGEIIKKYFKKRKTNWKVNLIPTGKKTMTGGRIRRLKKYLKDDIFLLTYGDGISNVNLKKLISFHKKSKNIVTLTSVRPPARFGSIKFKNNKIIRFREKSSLDEGWINGGFFVMDKRIFDYLKNDKTYLEKYPLETISKKNLLGGFKHTNFWQCMDTMRDKEILEKAFKKGLINFDKK